MRSVNKAMVLMVLCLVAVGGCGGVWMNAEYSALLDETTALSAETACRAEAGQLDPNEMAAALRSQANVWGKFRDARDGAAPTTRASATATAASCATCTTCPESGGN